MIAVDTNVLVRIITYDDQRQANRAVAFLRSQNSVFVAKTVLLELEWVLRSAYGIRRNGIVSAVRILLNLGNIELEDETEIAQALNWYEKGMDLADAIHLVSAGDRRQFATFDTSLRRRARRLGAGVTQLIH